MVSFPGVMVVMVVSSVAVLSAGAQPVRANAAIATAAIPALTRDSVLFLDMVCISFCLGRSPTYLGIEVVTRFELLKFAELYPRGLVHR